MATLASPVVNASALLRMADMRDPHVWYPGARSFPGGRTIIAHLGPTNSGKTYRALERLKTSSTGVYAGPLRLLAWEVFERLNSESVPCSLVTGQERTVKEDAGHVACTIEMSDVVHEWDVVVIDEIQMIADPDRGSAWTRLLLGAQAPEVHVAGDPACEKLLRRICELTGDRLEVHKYERLSPLQTEKRPMRRLSEAKPGDCVVCFGRRSLFNAKRVIEMEAGLKCGVIYGALPPSVRKSQAKGFNDPDGPLEVLVATDAVGMGLNLQVQRVVFRDTSKFDGKEVRPLTVSEVKQIGGRAGRYGAGFDGGKVSTLDDARGLSMVKKYLRRRTPQLRRAGIGPTVEQLELFAIALAPEAHRASALALLRGRLGRRQERLQILAEYLKASTDSERLREDENGDAFGAAATHRRLVELQRRHATERSEQAAAAAAAQLPTGVPLSAVGADGYDSDRDLPADVLESAATSALTASYGTMVAADAVEAWRLGLEGGSAASGGEGEEAEAGASLPSFVQGDEIDLDAFFAGESGLQRTEDGNLLVPFSMLLRLFDALARVDDQLFFNCDIEEVVSIAKRVDHIDLPIRVRYRFCMAPVQQTDGAVVDFVQQFAQDFADNGEVRLQVRVPKDEATTPEDLRALETIHGIFDVYLWLAQRYPREFVDEELLLREMEVLEGHIAAGLERMAERQTAQRRRLPGERRRRGRRRRGHEREPRHSFRAAEPTGDSRRDAGIVEQEMRSLTGLPGGEVALEALLDAAEAHDWSTKDLLVATDETRRRLRQQAARQAERSAVSERLSRWACQDA